MQYKHLFFILLNGFLQQICGRSHIFVEHFSNILSVFVAGMRYAMHYFESVSVPGSSSVSITQ